MHGHEEADHTLYQLLAHRTMFQMLFERILALGVRTARRDRSLVDSRSFVGVVTRVGHSVDYAVTLFFFKIGQLVVAVVVFYRDKLFGCSRAKAPRAGLTKGGR